MHDIPGSSQHDGTNTCLVTQANPNVKEVPFAPLPAGPADPGIHSH